MAERTPSYLALARIGELDRRANALWGVLENCELCPHHCHVNRLADDYGRCLLGAKPAVSAYVAHHGEEPCLSGTRGAGNIFFSSCNLRCVYCQNHQISQDRHRARSDEISIEALAGMALSLQAQGCHVLGLVSPSHTIAYFMKALPQAVAAGFSLPLVYNTNAYDDLNTLRLLDGIIDIYLPDLKYSDDEIALRYSHIPNYWETACAAITEMWRQVGPLEMDDDGIARRGLLLRHLVLPNNLAGSERCLRWLRDTLGPGVTLSIMAQYYPIHKAARIPELARGISYDEYERVVELALDLGFENLFAQEHAEAPGHYRPDFTRNHPFHPDPVGGATS